MICKVVWQVLPELSRQYAQRFSPQTQQKQGDNALAAGTQEQLARELQLRCRPLREQWEARGPGLLAHLAKKMPWSEFPETVSVALVQPVHGGGGAIVDKMICFEAVLANPLPQLPEVLRLGWFIARLALQDALRHTPVSTFADLSDELIALSLILPVLSAGERVELSTVDVATVQCALDAWQVLTKPATTPAQAQQLLDWWQQLVVGKSLQDAQSWWQSVQQLR